MDVIPTFQLEWEVLKRLPEEQLGLVAMLVPPLCAQKPHSPRTQSSSWLRGSQGSALGPAKPHWMELFLWFMDINSSVCPDLFAHKWPAKEAAPHCTDGVKSVKKIFFFF